MALDAAIFLDLLGGDDLMGFDERGRLRSKAALAPTFAGIPCLFPTLELLPLWRGLVEAFRATAVDNQRRIEAAARASGLPSTRIRLQRQAHGWGEMAVIVGRLFASERQGKSIKPTSDAARSQAASRLLDGFGLLVRDWCREPSAETENDGAIAQLLDVIPPNAQLGRVLVLGAGSARLAIDLHVATRPLMTVGLDVNPLPFVVARHILRGEAVTVFQFPATPDAPQDGAVKRTLTRPGPLPQGIHLMFSDARMPPVRPGEFSTLLTPWYIDQVTQSLPDICDTVHAVLPPGGLWLNLGPLIYAMRTQLQHRFTFPELCALLETRGFAIESRSSRMVPHLVTPQQTSSLRVEVHAFAARKLA